MSILIVTPLLAPASEIMAALKIEQEDNFELCLEHHQELYRQLVGACPCATRYSPNSDLVNNILGVAKLEGIEPLSSTDYICATYRSHVAIFKSHESETELT